jgi:hypothetical protein
MNLFENWAKSVLLEVQEYVRLQIATFKGIFSRPYYFHDIV